MYALNNNVTYFDGFGVELVPKEIKKFIGNKSSNGSRIIKNIFRIKAYDSVMCRYFSIEFINFILASNTLTDLTNFFLQIIFKIVMT